MRLICGFVRLDGAPADPSLLDAMIKAMTRPPCLPTMARRVEGETAMAVLDFVPGAAPEIVSDRAGVWLAGDLRLDRPRELATSLALPMDTRDNLLGLASVTRWDMNVPDRMHGDFALAAWDPARKRLLCARDAMGTRPLCYTHSPGKLFAFASLPKGLHGSGVVPARPDLVALARSLAAGVQFSDDGTGFHDIAWLRAGHSLSLAPEGIQIQRAFNPNPDSVGIWCGTPDEAALQLRTLVQEAVACRLRSNGPIATHLSGGLDSSAIVVIAARLLREQGRQLYAYSQVVDTRHGDLVDERKFIDAVLAQEPGIAWTPVFGHDLGAVQNADADLDASGGRVVSHETICADAAQKGVHMLLSGAGGDESATFNGAAIYASVLRQGGFRLLAAELRARARRESRSVTRLTMERLIMPYAPDWLLTFRRRLMGKPPRRLPTDALGYLRPDLAHQAKASLSLPRGLNNGPKHRIWMLTESYVVGRSTSWAVVGARHGIAFGFPLLDRRIIDFMLSLPLKLFLRDGYQRQPFRTAMLGILPETIRLRDSKFVPFPDAPVRLAGAKPLILSQIETVRQNTVTSTIFDFDRIAASIRAAPEGSAAQDAAERNNVGAPTSGQFARAIDALRALRLAEHIARLS